jgi:hypothetical protein
MVIVNLQARGYYVEAGGASLRLILSRRSHIKPQRKIGTQDDNVYFLMTEVLASLFERRRSSESSHFFTYYHSLILIYLFSHSY